LHTHFLSISLFRWNYYVALSKKGGRLFTVDLRHLHLSTLTGVNSIVCSVHGVKPELQTFFGGYTLYGNNH